MSQAGPYKIPSREVYEELRNQPIIVTPSKGGGANHTVSALTIELADEICARLSDGESLTTILDSGEHMPTRWTIYRWLRQHEWFERMYRQARQNQIDTLVDQIPDIADDATNDYMERVRKDGSTDLVLNDEHVRRSQIRIAARQWLAERIAPKKYGPKAELAVGNPDGSNIEAPTTIMLVAATAEDAKKAFEGLDSGEVIDVDMNEENQLPPDPEDEIVG